MPVPDEAIDWHWIDRASTKDLVAYLREPCSVRNRELRREALRVLGRRRSPETFALFTELLAGQEGSEIDLAAEALARLGDPAAIPHLERAYAEASRIATAASVSFGSVEMRPTGLLAALMRLRPSDELVRLLRMSEHPHPRVLAAMELGRRGEPGTAEALRHALDDPNHYVREAAGEAIERLGDTEEDRCRRREWE